jgi:acyl dehydratase
MIEKQIMNQRIVHSLEELRGLVGQEVAVGDWFTLSQSRINAFAEVSEDRQWIHVDVERARTDLPQGKTIAHRFLTLSLLSHLIKQALLLKVEFKQGINYGFNRIRFPAPVPAGSEIRVRCTLLNLEEVPGGIQIGWAATLEVKDVSKPALVAEWLVRYYH